MFKTAINAISRKNFFFDLFVFRSFFAWTFFNFLARCEIARSWKIGKRKTFKSGDALNLNSSLFIQNILRCPAPGKRGANKMASTNFPSGIKTHKFSKIGNFDQKSCTYHHMCSEIKMSFIFRSDLIFDK